MASNLLFSEELYKAINLQSPLRIPDCAAVRSPRITLEVSLISSECTNIGMQEIIQKE